MMQVDVLVVGAGPAGAATALQLARAGVGVTIIERAAFPRRKICGEYLGAGALAALDALELGEDVRKQGSALHGVRIASAGTRLELRFGRAALSLTRERLDGTILAAARHAGARLLRGRVDDIVRDGGGRVAGVAFRDDDGERRELRARFLVGADGVGSTVARKLGLTRSSRGMPRFAVGGHYRDVAEANGCIEMFVDRHAYLAINPLGDGLANVMAVVPKTATERWARTLDLAAGSRVGPRVATGPLAHRVRRAIAPGALLVGDAAGFLSPFTGQGVMLALRGAQRAAAAIGESLASAGAEASALKRYERARRGELARRGRRAAVVDVLVHVPVLARPAAAHLRRSPRHAAMLLDALVT
jgi:flavin-dependent dehydrogenase